MKRFRNWWQGLSDLERLQARIMLLLVAVGLISSLLGIGLSSNVEAFALNFGTEMLGAAVTFWLLGLLLGGRQKQAEKEREEQELKAQLIRQMGSTDNALASGAIRELAAHGWLYDDSLQGADLIEANLQGAQLGSVNLKRANLMRANLQGAFLLQTNLQEAGLYEANLERASLWAANLQGADLLGANLQGADLHWALPNEKTRLPDGTRWTPEADPFRFTDPNHPDFWRADHPESPAYQGDNDKEDDNHDNDDH